MNSDPQLEAILNQLTKGSVFLWKILGGASFLSGIGMTAVVIFAPFKKGEGPIVAGFAAFALLLLGLGVWAPFWAQRQGNRMRDLAINRPHDIRTMKVVRAASRNGIVMWGLHVTDQNGRLTGLKVPNERTGLDLMRRFAERGARQG
jgi:hypothetical protein